jgi:phosphoglycolate phosphatase
MKKRYDLIVFDWDGTLMDSAAKIVACFRSALQDAGAADPGDAAIRHIIGLGLNEAADALLPNETPTVRQQVVERYRQHFLHLNTMESEMFPGVQPALEDLTRRGHLLAIATGKSRRGLNRVLEQTGLGPLFVASRCADEAFSKPHPQMLMDILEFTGMSPEQAIVVGDTAYDMEMAHNAGVDRLAVSYGVHAREQLLPHAPVACVDSFTDVHRWLA